ncbi:hypothetical protein EVAR_86009_1 [Eumeta japonica]|uniref:Uncharacterized protein n=1 Tax=Eumeta variegata TaxID=151549 RepID=A0A4C1UK86_EUMVA|nr:hypothetical protein EVAR_86009_1 [Eumeta japonica]
MYNSWVYKNEICIPNPQIDPFLKAIIYKSSFNKNACTLRIIRPRFFRRRLVGQLFNIKKTLQPVRVRLRRRRDLAQPRDVTWTTSYTNRAEPGCWSFINSKSYKSGRGILHEIGRVRASTIVGGARAPCALAHAAALVSRPRRQEPRRTAFSFVTGYSDARESWCRRTVGGRLQESFTGAETVVLDFLSAPAQAQRVSRSAHHNIKQLKAASRHFPTPRHSPCRSKLRRRHKTRIPSWNCGSFLDRFNVLYIKILEKLIGQFASAEDLNPNLLARECSIPWPPAPETSSLIIRGAE